MGKEKQTITASDVASVNVEDMVGSAPEVIDEKLRAFVAAGLALEAALTGVPEDFHREALTGVGRMLGRFVEGKPEDQRARWRARILRIVEDAIPPPA